MKLSPPIFLFALLLLLSIGQVFELQAQNGCKLIDETKPAQYLSFEKVERDTRDAKVNSNVVLRLSNNSTCDIFFHIDSVSGGELKLNDVQNDELLQGVHYEIEYLKPRKGSMQTLSIGSHVIDRFYLRKEMSVLFKVPLQVFDEWVSIQLYYWYEWDEFSPKADRNKAWRPPAHYVFFGSQDLPDEVFRRTKIYLKK